MEILYQDKEILVCIKEPGIVSEATAAGDGLADRLAQVSGGYIGTVHRLDRAVGGVMVYAKTPQSAAKLSDAVRTKAMKKEYLALVHGVPEPASGSLADLLWHDKRLNKTFVVERSRTGVKEALLDYRVRDTRQDPQFGVLSLVEIRLHTGRTHQIRVQFASRRHPLLGDRKYGAKESGPMGLFAARLTFPHPITGREMHFSAHPSGEIWDKIQPDTI